LSLDGTVLGFVARKQNLHCINQAVGIHDHLVLSGTIFLQCFLKGIKNHLPGVIGADGNLKRFKTLLH
jgi:hypothetical protein